jgi:hypothetical protein
VSPAGSEAATDKPLSRRNHGMSAETLAAASRVMGRLAGDAKRSAQPDGEFRESH